MYILFLSFIKSFYFKLLHDIWVYIYQLILLNDPSCGIVLVSIYMPLNNTSEVINSRGSHMWDPSLGSGVVIFKVFHHISADIRYFNYTIVHHDVRSYDDPSGIV